MTPLYLASYYGHLDIVKYLIKKGANPNLNIGNETATRMASLGGHSDVVDYLKEFAPLDP